MPEVRPSCRPSRGRWSIYRLETGRWLLLDTFEEDAVVRAEPFEALELSLGVLRERQPRG